MGGRGSVRAADDFLRCLIQRLGRSSHSRAGTRRPSGRMNTGDEKGMKDTEQPKRNTEHEKAFFTAIRQGSFDEVKAMVAKTPGLLNAFNYESFGATPLTMVSFCGARQMMDVLLDLGVDINLSLIHI